MSFAQCDLKHSGRAGGGPPAQPSECSQDRGCAVRPDSWASSYHTSSPCRLSTVEPVDVLKALGVHRNQAGVAEGPGMCPQRTPHGDRAFRVDKSSLLSVPTWQLFPGESGQEGWGGAILEG